MFVFSTDGTKLDPGVWRKEDINEGTMAREFKRTQGEEDDADDQISDNDE